MSSGIKLLAIDLDGTLLDRTRNISNPNREAIADAVSAGVEVVLASGRFQPSMAPFAEALGLVGPMICSNGAHVIGRNRQELGYDSVDADQVDTILSFASERGIHINAYTRDELLFSGNSEWGDLYRSRLKTIEPVMATHAEIRSRDLSKVMIVADPRALRSFRDELEKILDLDSVAITESEPEYLEFLAAAVNKGTALAKVASACHVEAAQVAAIGDYLNDVEMLRWVGLSAAVDNAHADVKAIANLRVFSHDNDGVAQFIRGYVVD